MDKLSYALGMSMASNLMNSGLKNIDVDSFVKAFTEIMDNKTPSMSPQEANQILQDYFTKQQDEMLNKNLEAGKAFLEENKKREGVVTLPSGLQYEVINEGDGAIPKATDKVKCHYHGTLIDGTVFDSSVQRGQPAVFGVNQVIKGWVEALQLMSVGSKWRLYIPSDLAYGKQGAGGSIEPNTTLIFDVELLGIV
ncbi:MAG TPA: FKBP-type peptidyl-prolyl cis-trans isomerase [Fermentimonas caenicola]|jgi:FKBP-type peptidyl-prolyl cis-trans isomerase FklB|uniref:Peptidyl-prolyl cis-trans isomerase n=1 Tax=Fermentimonas caenicola TaxID=1562970 RepID=A0A098C2K1_9BACT|nr:MULTISPECIES: FKBP-type peptidyl-prolyl cis-trans isomerase [Lascolabacillus]MBP6175278.1 FKBP-type peptidyl-prolyl cis-trans isomerase [Fermentimonas sp.]MDI9625158.1 FKBP-type peptidyl-prolyl cis-trans isomerase [Bacteroidota bacterium]TAH62529.1 MAG: FKBP-type peptidyl-prolyl cis-trans isomerase [Fermentimonas caenicola]MBP6196913.1 FKBP-type peptidyl-prolyl cis-trans isomerase [Fermentimonas sp.]MBP7104807.1 FKBP-type peptidyl-prolyl cis-trans isomerase [Fermentimonas sp.]